MTGPKRVTIISPRVFTFISICYFGMVGLSIAKYFSKHDPYYPFQAVVDVGIWLLWLYIYQRGRRSRLRGDSSVGEDTTQRARS